MNKTSTKIVALIAFVLLATATILIVRAATSNPSVESENAELTNIEKKTGEESSNNKFIEFGETKTEPAADIASYRISFDFLWSEATHSPLPSGAHVSPVVVTTHANPGALFTKDNVATSGFEQVAESGATGIIITELNDLKALGVLDYEIGERKDVPDKLEISIDATQTNSLLSLVTMLAPSPDWVIGLQDFELFDKEKDAWLVSKTMDLSPYDAGTDDGSEFDSSDADTEPNGPITEPQDESFKNVSKSPFATVSIEKL